MRAEIIAVGDELLLGQVVNTNATFIAHHLTQLGLDVQWITAVGDDRQRLLEAIRLAEQRADVIIATGGLGPTHDDITKHVVAEYFQSQLILDAGLLEKLTDRFRRRGRSLTPSNRSQAIVPHNSTILENEVGTAPGLLFCRGGKYFFVLPGVPAEMMWLMQAKVMPILQNKANKVIRYRVLHTTGISESAIFEGLDQIEALERYARIAFLPTYSGVNIRLTAQGPTSEFCDANLDQVEAAIREKFNAYIWGVDDETLEDKVAAILIQQHKKCALVEYGTGGQAATLLAKQTSCDQFFLYGITIVSWEAARNMFGSLAPLGPQLAIVSEKSCSQLAVQLQRFSGADVTLAIVHDERLDVTSYVAVCQNGQVRTHSYILKFEPTTNSQRLSALSLMFLYQQLQR